MKKRIVCIVSALVLSLGLFVGCSGGELYRLSYYDETNPITGYNENLFYENDMETAAADPTVIYIDDKNNPEDDGWFFMYPTSDNFGGHGFCAYRSRDMKSWQYVGPILDPEADSFAHDRCWAPEVIYDAEVKKYYIFFSAADYNNTNHLLFKNNEEKETYNAAEREINALVESVGDKTQAVRALYDEIEEWSDFFGGIAAGDEIDGVTYTEEDLDTALKTVISVMESDFQGDLDRELNAVKNAVLKLRTVKIVTVYNERDYGIGVGVSDSPRGPFTQYTNVPDTEGYNAANRTISIDLPFISHEDIYPWLAEHKSEYWKGAADDASNGQMTAGEPTACMIDVHPYVDPKTGDKYLYMIRDVTGGGSSFPFVIKMGERWTDDPKWETTTRLGRCGYYTTDDMSQSNQTDLVEDDTNEGVYMYYNADADKYYMTVSCNKYYRKGYSVIQAIGDSPMGPFRKLSLAEGGKITGTEVDWDHVSGPGHHSFCEYDGRLYIIYHAHYDRKNEQNENNRPRGSCVDPVVWIKNGNGETIMHCNGPTYSYQPKIGPDMEYVNIAADAKIKASNTAKGSDAKYLNDGVIKFFSWDEFINEFVSGKGKKTKITIKFDEWRYVRALMIYNTFDYSYHWENVDRVELDFLNKEGKKSTALIENLKFDVNRHINIDKEFMRPGGAAIAEFDELQVKEIRITFKHDSPIAISEIYVLGK